MFVLDARNNYWLMCVLVNSLLVIYVGTTLGEGRHKDNLRDQPPPSGCALVPRNSQRGALCVCSAMVINVRDTYRPQLQFAQRFKKRSGPFLDRAGAKKWIRKEIQRGVVDDQNLSKVARSKKHNFSTPSKRTGGLMGTKAVPLRPSSIKVTVFAMWQRDINLRLTYFVL